MNLKLSLARGLAGALLGATLAACGLPPAASEPVPSQPAASQPPATPAPSSAAPVPTTVPLQPTAVPASQPVLGFEPKSGAPGTVVAVWGSGYIPDAPVVVRLGLPQPTGEVLLSAFASKDGRWSGSLTIPEQLPSGAPVPGGALRLVVMNEQNQALASAPFELVPPTPHLSWAAAAQTVHDMLGAWNYGDIKSFVTADLRTKLQNHETTDDLLGLHGLRLVSFEVQPAQDRPSDVLFVPATLVYEEFTEERIYELVVVDSQWRVSGSSLVKTHANRPQDPNKTIVWEGLRIRVPEGYTTDTQIHGAGAINGAMIEAHLALIPISGATPGEPNVEQPPALIFDVIAFNGNQQAWFDSLYPAGSQITAYPSALNDLSALAYRPAGPDSSRVGYIAALAPDRLLLVEADTAVPLHQEVLDTITFASH